MNTEWTARLFALQDTGYRDFQSRLIPTADPETVIGVRTPALKKLAGELFSSPERDDFMKDLPHRYYEEDHLHAVFISMLRDYEELIRELDRFLPYVTNWSVCDSLLPKIQEKDLPAYARKAQEWILSGETYTVRYGIGVLMRHFLEEHFSPVYPQMVSEVKSGEYYVNMMSAWYFATALAKQYDAVLPYLTEHKLSPWVHNRTIQKAVESFRITEEQKNFLRTLRIPKNSAGKNSRKPGSGT